MQRSHRHPRVGCWHQKGYYRRTTQSNGSQPRGKAPEIVVRPGSRPVERSTSGLNKGCSVPTFTSLPTPPSTALCSYENQGHEPVVQRSGGGQRRLACVLAPTPSLTYGMPKGSRTASAGDPPSLSEYVGSGTMWILWQTSSRWPSM